VGGGRPFSGSPWGLTRPDLRGAVPTGPVADLFRGILQRSDKYCLRTWYPQQYGQQTGTYLDFGGTDESAIRPAAAAAFGLAVSLSTGAYDPTTTGVASADARAVCVKLARSLAYRHRHTAAGGWGWQWQSNMWAALAAQAAWLVADGLTAQQQRIVADMVVDEADWRLSQVIPFWKNRAGVELTPGDSKAEESSWNAMLLQAAVVMLPAHPHRGAWLLNCRKLMISAFSSEADLTSNEVVDGINVSRFLNGWNLNRDGTVVNHDRLHPDYMTTVLQDLQAVCLFALAGYAPPQSSFHNADVVYSGLTSKTFASPPYAAPGGTIYRPNLPDLYYPQGNDWGTGRRMHVAALDVMMGAFGRVAGAFDWAQLHGGEVARMQRRSTTGQTYIAAGEDTYPGREQWVAQHAAWAWLSLWVVSTGKYVPSSSP
jgi:hypothetical protein